MATDEQTGFDPGGPGSGTYRPKTEPGLAFPRECTALLVIDPVNDFLSEGGADWDLTHNTVRMHDVIGHLRMAIEGARERGIPVLFGPMAYTAEDYADERLQRRSGINRYMFERRMFQAGSWGADFHPELQPADGDIVLLPHKSMDVFETDLPHHLDRHGITHLVIAGMTANLCCESTGRHAMERGYDVTYLSDAIGASTIAAYEAAVHLNFPLIANAVITTAEFLKAIDEPSATRSTEVQVGDTVRGSDHLEIGEVARVVAPDAETDGYLLVRRGALFKHDTYIPLDAVTRRSGTVVFINVPRLFVGKMAWDAPPSPATWKDKLGRSAAAVARLYGSYSPTSMHPRTSGR
jgi:ureidoacrylate peracid hydrolase